MDPGRAEPAHAEWHPQPRGAGQRASAASPRRGAPARQLEPSKQSGMFHPRREALRELPRALPAQPAAGGCRARRTSWRGRRRERRPIYRQGPPLGSQCTPPQRPAGDQGSPPPAADPVPSAHRSAAPSAARERADPPPLRSEQGRKRRAAPSSARAHDVVQTCREHEVN